MLNMARIVLLLILATFMYGVIPAMVTPIADWPWPLSKTGYDWPFPSTPQSAVNAIWVLMFPVFFGLIALLRGRFAYHGIWVVFLAVGLLIKYQQMPLWMSAIVLLIGIAGAVNYYAFTKLTGATFDEVARIRHGKNEKIQTMTLQGGNASSNQEPSDHILYPAVFSKLNFSKLVGMTELKARLLKAGKEIIAKRGARNGILLTGEPGNGKTAMAEALAGELKLPLVSVSFGEINSKWVGETTSRAMKVFDDAVAQSPCVLFIDEADAVLIDRETVHNADSESVKLVNSLLKRIQDIRSQGVVLVAATNYIDRLDKAAIREGRFDYKIEITAPDEEARIYLLKNSLARHSTKVSPSGMERAAKRWEGFSVSRIRAIGAEAVSMLEAREIEQIGFDELMQSLRKIQSSKGTPIPESVPTLEGLVLSKEMRGRMKSLSRRMVEIERIEEMGGSVPRGVLFSGPPGTGKTLGAMALAKTTNWSFIATTGQDLLADENEIERIMAKAKDLRPCILFIDEADDVLADRRLSPMSKRITNKLITFMDGAGGQMQDVLFIAATNAPELIDEAALRGGRLTEKIVFTLPEKADIQQFIEKWMTGSKARFDPALDIGTVAEALAGQSLANVKETMREAVNHSLSRDDSTVGMQDILKASENFKLERV
jgi:transitional endoplasmic reticulum ATPase